jgi:hypothetical protein
MPKRCCKEWTPLCQPARWKIEVEESGMKRQAVDEKRIRRRA